MCTTYNELRNLPREDGAIDIKLEASPSDASHSLLYSPTIPLRPSSLPVTSAIPPNIRRRHTNSLSPKRPRPYPALPRDSCNRQLDDLSFMATSPADYTNWPSGSSLSRPRSRLTSSLSNAMGDAHISSHPRTGASPAPRDDFPNMGWLPSQPQQQIASGHHDVYPVVPGLVPSHDDPGQYINYTSTYRNVSPESLSPQSPPFTPSPSAYDYHFSQSHSPMSASLHPPSDAEAEIQNLRRKLHEAQNQKALAEERSRQLGIQVQHLNRSMSSSSSAMLGLPSLSAPAPTQSFQKSWDLRTQARIRLYCSLNRAGNALCAWHDSRRERRAYPPRMAPPGYLNCGCTYEQALFEESLSRHNVGCYLPGETVRMDPALRNPLLKLLEERFGYRDGDFERDPMTGMWVQGEGHECWERKLQAGPANSRKARSG